MHRKILVQVLVDFKRVIVHCSDTPDYSKDALTYDYDVDDIRAWHLKRGWSDIGYHFVITRSGELQEGRALSRMGAHVKGENHDSLGICLIGKEDFLDEQFKILGDLYAYILLRFKIDSDQWYCHNQFDRRKTCPGFFYDYLRGYLKGIRV